MQDLPFDSGSDAPKEQTGAPGSQAGDDQILADARAFFETAEGAMSESFKEGKIDLEFLVGNHWPEQQRRARELDGRPVLTVNKLPNFLSIVTNQQRQNRPSIKISPADGRASEKTALVMQGMVRHIEYDSSADVAYDTAVNSAATVGFGYFRLVTEYEDEFSFDQKIAFRRIRNPFTVLFDPASTEPDGSDAERVLLSTKISKTLFKAQYPNAQLSNSDFASSMAGSYRHWCFKDEMRIAEFYRIEREPQTLCRTADGQIFWEDELPEGVKPAQKRQSFRKKVMWYKLTGYEVLERVEIKCPGIPVFPVYGSEVDLDGKIYRAGLIRNARDPQLMYDFWMTSATEEVAMRPKTPFIGAEGQFEGFEQQWRSANVRSHAYLEYKPVTVDGQIAPAPSRQPMADIPNGMLTMAMHANDNIKATTGLFDSSLGAIGNATSGKQEIAQQNQGNIANFHYTDNLQRSLRWAGKCLIHMIRYYYDTERVVQIMGEDGSMDHATINGTDDQGQKVNDVTYGKYDCIVSVGPSYNTLRKEAADAMVQFGQSWPKLMDIAGDKVVKAMDWPGAQEIAKRIENIIPPSVRYDPEDPNAGPPPLPPEVEKQLQEMQQHLQEMQQENMELKAGLGTAQIKAQAQVEAAQILAESKRDVEEIKGWVGILMKKLEPPPELTAEVREEAAGD